MKRLGLDYLDLFLCHKTDPYTPISETIGAMDQLVRQGKILYWGISGWDTPLILEAFEIAEQMSAVKPSVVQPQYNMFEREPIENHLLPVFHKHGIGSTVWSPLASGLLTGKYNSSVPEGSRASRPDMDWLANELHDERVGQIEDLMLVAEEMEITPAQLAIAWVASSNFVSSVLIGASSEKQLRENLGAIDVVSRIDEACLSRIDAILGNRPTPIEKNETGGYWTTVD